MPDSFSPFYKHLRAGVCESGAGEKRGAALPRQSVMSRERKTGNYMRDQCVVHDSLEGGLLTAVNMGTVIRAGLPEELTDRE